jgi:flagellar protein FliJ
LFVFKLQSVLEHRKAIEEIALREFSDATVKLNSERRTMTALVEKERLLIGQWRELAGRPAKASDFSLYGEYIKRVKQSRCDQATILSAAEEETERKRAALLAIVKERKILEKLKEKRHLAYEARNAERERKTLDEVAILKFKWGEP